MELFLQDLRHAFRMFRKNRVFTAAAVAALALGIGANTAIFSVVSAVLLKPLPFPDAGQRGVLHEHESAGTGRSGLVSGEVRALAAADDGHSGRDGLSDERRQLHGRRRARAAAGRPGERGLLQALWRTAVQGANVLGARKICPAVRSVAVLSHGLWARRFGSDPDIIGKTILLSGDPHEVIGIISPTFDLAEVGQPPELWVPFQLDPNTVDQGHFFQSAARLKRGVSLEQGQARLKLSAAEYTAKFPNALGDGGGFGLERMQTVFVRGAQAYAAHSQRRRRLRAAHCLRQRREPAAGACHGPQA